MRRSTSGCLGSVPAEGDHRHRAWGRPSTTLRVAPSPAAAPQERTADCGFFAFASKLVVMDEPTAALGVQETAQVENIIRNLKSRGIPLILISHNLRQVFDLVDRIWVFRRGRIAGVVDRDKTSGNEVVSMITGVTEAPGEASAFA